MRRFPVAKSGVMLALVWRRTRLAAYAVVVISHLTNAWLWDIGIFPWFMIAAMLLFFRPDLPKPVVKRFGLDAERGVPAEDTSERKRRIVTGLVVAFCTVQMLIPCRPFLHGGHPLEQRDLMLFSWNMMLSLDNVRLQFLVVDHATGEETFVAPGEFLSDFQARGRLGWPDMMHQAALHLAEQRGGDVSVYLLGAIRVNARDWQVAYDPGVDLASTPRTIGPKPWVVPFEQAYPPDAVRRAPFYEAKWEFCREKGYLPFAKSPSDPQAAEHVRQWEEAYRNAMTRAR